MTATPDAATWAEMRAAAGTGREVEVTLVERTPDGATTYDYGPCRVLTIDRRRKGPGWLEVATVEETTTGHLRTLHHEVRYG